VLVRTDFTRWTDPTRARNALEKASYVVMIDTDRREAAQYADVVLPIATYAESDGTFTNHASRVQCFHEAIVPPGEVRAGWRVLGELGERVTREPMRASATLVFDALAGEGGAFAGQRYDTLGAEGAIAVNARASA
jgi:predicted molibdopterin-dependent oxidoreductase YjgC